MLFFGKVDNFLASVGTTGLGFSLTDITLNKQQVTGLVGAIDMSVARGSALVALGNDVVRNPFGTALVKDKVFPFKFIFKPEVFDLACVFDYTSF